MKPLEIRVLTGIVVDSLERSGITKPGRIMLDIDPGVPEVLYGDTDEVRKLLYVILSTLADPVDCPSVSIRILADQGKEGGIDLQVSFRCARIPLHERQLSPFIEKLSGTFTINRPTRTGSPGAGMEELRCLIPVADSPSFFICPAADTADPPFAFERLAGEINEPETAFRIIQDYMVHLGLQIDLIAEAMVGRDEATVHRLAHAIRGGALNIHAPRLGQAANALEIAAKYHRLEKGQEMLGCMRLVYRELTDYVRLLEIKRGV